MRTAIFAVAAVTVTAANFATTMRSQAVRRTQGGAKRLLPVLAASLCVWLDRAFGFQHGYAMLGRISPLALRAQEPTPAGFQTGRGRYFWLGAEDSKLSHSPFNYNAVPRPRRMTGTPSLRMDAGASADVRGVSDPASTLNTQGVSQQR
jgi:hypothetical protein